MLAMNSEGWLLKDNTKSSVAGDQKTGVASDWNSEAAPLTGTLEEAQAFFFTTAGSVSVPSTQPPNPYIIYES